MTLALAAYERIDLLRVPVKQAPACVLRLTSFAQDFGGVRNSAGRLASLKLAKCSRIGRRRDLLKFPDERISHESRKFQSPFSGSRYLRPKARGRDRAFCVRETHFLGDITTSPH